MIDVSSPARYKKEIKKKIWKVNTEAKNIYIVRYKTCLSVPNIYSEKGAELI